MSAQIVAKFLWLERLTTGHGKSDLQYIMFKFQRILREK